MVFDPLLEDYKYILTETRRVNSKFQPEVRRHMQCILRHICTTLSYIQLKIFGMID